MALDIKHEEYIDQLNRVNQFLASRAALLPSLPTTANGETIASALQLLPKDLPDKGLGLQATTSLLLDHLSPAMAVGQAGPRYFGLVTGGVLPSAQLADHLVTTFDQNVQVYFPEESIATVIEQLSLNMILSMLSLPLDRFTSNTVTTGATASNLLGLIVGREHVVAQVQKRRGIPSPSGLPEWSVGEDGFGGVDVSVFCAGAHASIAKVASMAGIGRRSVEELVDLEDESQPCAFDLKKLEEKLKGNVGKAGSIVVTSFGEVNSGGFTPHTKEIRELCDKYDAWLHCDAAFGAFAAVLPDFQHVSTELALADSITSDAHKWLNVPYDAGLFFSRSNYLVSTLGPGKNAAAYLASSSSTTDASPYPAIDPYRLLPSTLFTNVENSRRFRALPVYSALLALGKKGYTELFERNVSFARQVEGWMRQGGGGGSFEILTPISSTTKDSDFRTMNIVLFGLTSKAPERFLGEDGAREFVKELNSGKKVYLTATKWRGRGAVRVAVSNWGTLLDRDFDIFVKAVEEVLSK
ncbi:PLP-dependent transferase [Meredithblackwellia eburnea MCA 4105]